MTPHESFPHKTFHHDFISDEILEDRIKISREICREEGQETVIARALPRTSYKEGIKERRLENKEGVEEGRLENRDGIEGGLRIVRTRGQGYKNERGMKMGVSLLDSTVR